MPTCFRAVPDFTNDYCFENEHKLAVPFYAQTDCYSCGATAGLAVMRTFHPRASFRSFYRACSPSPENGTTEARLVKALRSHGIGVSIRTDLDYASIRAAIESGFPIIAGTGVEMFDDGDHWTVIYGIGWKPRRVFICNQPRLGYSREELSWNEFRSIWTPRGRGLVCWGKSFRG